MKFMGKQIRMTNVSVYSFLPPSLPISQFVEGRNNLTAITVSAMELTLTEWRRPEPGQVCPVSRAPTEAGTDGRTDGRTRGNRWVPRWNHRSLRTDSFLFLFWELGWEFCLFVCLFYLFKWKDNFMALESVGKLEQDFLYFFDGFDGYWIGIWSDCNWIESGPKFSQNFIKIQSKLNRNSMKISSKFNQNSIEIEPKLNQNLIEI